MDLALIGRVGNWEKKEGRKSERRRTWLNREGYTNAYALHFTPTSNIHIVDPGEEKKKRERNAEYEACRFSLSSNNNNDDDDDDDDDDGRLA